MNCLKQTLPAIVSLVLFTATVTSNLYASQLAVPATYERVSVNGKYKVKVTAPNENKKINRQITVFAKQGKQWRQAWTVQPVNRVLPAKTSVSNNGVCVVTIGNVSGAPNNDDLVVYRDGELLKRYSLDDLLSEKVQPLLPVFASCTGGWQGSFEFVDQRQRLCLWVDPAREWVLVDLQKGTPIQLDQMTALICEEQTRIDAYANIKNKSGGDCYESYRRLARFLHAKDKPVFEELLTRPTSLGCGYQTRTDSDFIFYFASNHYRELAERVLAAIDDGKRDAIGKSNYWSMKDRQNGYRHLGSLNISATFEEAPKSSDGIVVLWLAPVDGADELRMKEPAHALGIDFLYKFPDTLKKANKPLAMPVKMSLFGVTPGKYRICGYWDRDSDNVYKIEEDFWKRTGDFVIADNPEIEIQMGRSVQVALSFTKVTPSKPDAGDGE